MSAPDLSFPDLSFLDLSFPDMSSPDLSFPNLSFPDLLWSGALLLPSSAVLVRPLPSASVPYEYIKGSELYDRAVRGLIDFLPPRAGTVARQALSHQANLQANHQASQPARQPARQPATKPENHKLASQPATKDKGKPT